VSIKEKLVQAGIFQIKPSYEGSELSLAKLEHYNFLDETELKLS
jgi:hypothetical protein